MLKPPEPIFFSNLSVASSISDKENRCADSVSTSLKYVPSFLVVGGGGTIIVLQLLSEEIRKYRVLIFQLHLMNILQRKTNTSPYFQIDQLAVFTQKKASM
jgi:hypothetical protein